MDDVKLIFEFYKQIGVSAELFRIPCEPGLTFYNVM